MTEALRSEFVRGGLPIPAGVVVVEGAFAGWDTPWRALSDADRIQLCLGAACGLPWIEVETGRERGWARRFALEVVPQVLVLLDGEVVARFHGRTTGNAVRAAVRSARARWEEVARLRTAGEGASGATAGGASRGGAFATLRAS